MPTRLQHTHRHYAKKEEVKIAYRGERACNAMRKFIYRGGRMVYVAQGKRLPHLFLRKKTKKEEKKRAENIWESKSGSVVGRPPLTVRLGGNREAVGGRKGI